jgi:hypothetical protein
MLDYDLSKLASEQINDESWWQGFTGNQNNLTEEWSEVAGLQNMDLTS